MTTRSGGASGPETIPAAWRMRPSPAPTKSPLAAPRTARYRKPSRLVRRVRTASTATSKTEIGQSSATPSTWFDFTVTPTTFQLEAGATQVVTVGVREVQQGAPSSGVDYDLSVTSTSDPSNNDAVSVRVESVVSNANITVFNDQASAKPGQSVYGSVILTNTGNTDDTFTITTVGTDCGLDTSVTLAPGLSSDALGWSCIVANDAQAGQQGIVFRAVSSVRTTLLLSKRLTSRWKPIGQAMPWWR